VRVEGPVDGVQKQRSRLIEAVGGRSEISGRFDASVWRTSTGNLAMHSARKRCQGPMQMSEVGILAACFVRVRRAAHGSRQGLYLFFFVGGLSYSMTYHSAGGPLRRLTVIRAVNAPPRA
jgi:hypothetical protein